MKIETASFLLYHYTPTETWLQLILNVELNFLYR